MTIFIICLIPCILRHSSSLSDGTMKNDYDNAFLSSLPKVV
jgi:hypothetical protein